MEISILGKGNLTDVSDVKQFFSVEEIGKAIITSNYSGIIFKDNYTKVENFLRCSMVILDFDNNAGEPQMSLQEAIETFAPYKHIISTTRNHRSLKKGVMQGDRFRVILFTEEPITTVDDYTATLLHVMAQYPAADRVCKDAARRFYPSKDVMSFKNEGKLISIVKGIKTSKLIAVGKFEQPNEKIEFNFRESVEFFTKLAPQGKWNHLLYQAAKDLQANGYTAEEFVIEAATMSPVGKLDKSDMSTIKSAYSTPPTHGPVCDRAMSEVERWTRNWFRDNKIEVSYKTGEIKYRGEARKADVLFSQLVLDAKLWAEQNPITTDKGKLVARIPYGEKNLEHVLNIWLSEQEKKTVQQYVNKLRFDPAISRDDLEAALEIVTGKLNPLDLCVFEHFIWQVKRKLNNLPVEWPIMPILQGRTGSGKTKFIELLLEPLDEIIIAPPSLKALEDSREAVMLTKFFVMFFDEMSRADKVEVEAMKNKISAKMQTYRKLGTNQMITSRNTANFIGASNKDLLDIILDPTSARRFWQIDTVDRIPYLEFDKLNMLNVWKSIDENAEAPIHRHKDEILKYQHNELRSKSNVEIWLEETMVQGGENMLSSLYVYDLFMEWVRIQGIKYVPTRNAFGREISKLGVKRGHLRNGIFYYLTEKNKETILSLVSKN